jgi:hypothetical protein
VVEIVQAKCWSKDKAIREKHIFQIFGTTVHFRKNLKGREIRPVFTATTELSTEAKDVTEALDIRIDQIDLPKCYPMIRCNINPSSKEKIYHLPFDQQYDKAIVGDQPGECYAMTAIEAEDLGFRRAWRYSGISQKDPAKPQQSKPKRKGSERGPRK